MSALETCPWCSERPTFSRGTWSFRCEPCGAVPPGQQPHHIAADYWNLWAQAIRRQLGRVRRVS